MRIKIERTKKEKTQRPEKKRKRVLRVGKKSKMVFVFWVLLIGSLSFSMYKNFTAIDREITHEKVVVKEKIVNTSGVENFTIDFAKHYFSWQNDEEMIDQRMKELGQYLTDDALALSQEMVREDIPTSSHVESVKVTNVSRVKEDFKVSFLIDQTITENKKEQKSTTAYTVLVHQDKGGNYIVISLPTMIGKPQKAAFKPKDIVSDTTIDAKTITEITEFLETFFKLYPSASKKELDYYVQNGALKPIDHDLTFVELVNPMFVKEGSVIQTKLAVKYLDPIAKTTSIFEYRLSLKKEGNWKIINHK